MRRPVAVVATLALLPAGGCYSYGRVPVTELRPDATVRVGLTSEAASRVASELGRRPEAPLRGTVVQVGSGQLLLGVAGSPESAGVSGSGVPFRQRIRISTSDITGVESRRLDTGKTLGLVAGAVAAGTAVVLWSFSATNGTPGGDGGKGGTNVSVSVPLRFFVPGP